MLGMLREVTELKKKIALMSKKNFTLENDIGALDRKIALLIKNRITLEEVLAAKGAMLETKDRTVDLKGRETELYGRLFYLLQRDTVYLSRLARIVKLQDIDNFLQTVMFTLYGNQYEEDEEHLLLTMFRTVLQADFAEAKSFSELLRANTPLSRMMTTYCRRGPGQQYLKSTLASLLGEIASEAALNLEINPVKVLEQYINDFESKQGRKYEGERKPLPEACAELPFVKEIIAPRIAKLEQLASQMVDALVRTIDLVPYGVRWICRAIKQLTRAAFPAATFEQVCSVIGGFFILRFVNPAVATPNAYMLVDAKLTATARRNFTLLAKVQQNLANNVPFGGAKEAYMAPLNSVLARCIAPLNQFLDRLTEVEDLDHRLSLDRYIALTKFSEHSITISLNEIYFIHQALLANRAEILEGPGHEEMKAILDAAPAAPAQLPRKENANVDLRLLTASKSGDDANLSKMEPEQLYGETKYLLFTLMRAIPRRLELADVDARRLLGQIAQWATTGGNQEVLERISKVLANCKQLVAMGMLSEDDNYARLRKDLADDVLNIDARIKRVQADLERLRAVFRTLVQRNEFGMSQLAVFQAYLENVRLTATMVASKGRKEKAPAASKEKQPQPQLASTEPHKFTHQALVKDGVIISSQIPEDKRSNTVFQFSMSSPGVFDVQVLYRSREIAVMKLHLDDLLERQSNNEVQIETDFITLSVNLLLYLLNRSFLAHK